MNNKALALLLILLFALAGYFLLGRETTTLSLEETGDLYFARREYKQAVNAWEKALGRARDNDRILQKVGNGFLRLAKFDRAEKAFNEAVEIAPGAVDLQLELVRLSLLKGELNAAQKRCTLLKTNAPLDPEVEILLGDMYLLESKPEKAETFYRNALLKSNGSARSLLKLATCLVILGKEQEADTFFTITDKPELRTPPILLQMADYFLVAGKDEKAEACFLEAVKKEPQDLGLKVGLACFYRCNHGLENAAAIFSSLAVADPDNLYFKKMLGDIYISLNKMDAAKTVIFSIGEMLKDPDPEYELLQGKYWLYEGNYVYAATHLKTAVDLIPGFSLAHYLLGVAYLMGGQNQLGENSIENALYLDPDQSRSLLLIASILYKKGKYSLSLDYLNRLKKLEPENNKAYRLEGLNLIALENYEKARVSFVSALSINPEDNTSLYLLGITAESLKMESLAMGCYKEVLDTNPLLADVLYRYTTLLIKKGDPKAADDVLAAVSEKNSASPYYYYVAALAALKTDRFEIAETHLKRAVSQDPILGDAHVSLADLYVRKGCIVKAITTLESCTVKAPEFADAWIRLASIYLETDKPLEALAVMERAEKKLPDSPAILGNLAWLYLVTESDPVLALDFARRAYEKSPDDPAIADTLAWAYYKKNAFGQAAWLLAALEVREPENGMVLYHHGMTLYRQGKLSEAVKKLKKASGAALGELDLKNIEETLSHLEERSADSTMSLGDRIEFDGSVLGKSPFQDSNLEDDMVKPDWGRPDW